MDSPITNTLCFLCEEFAHALLEATADHGYKPVPIGGRVEQTDWLDGMTRWSGVFKHHACFSDLVSSAQICQFCRLLQTNFESLAGTEARMPEYCSGWLGLYCRGSAAYTTIGGGLPAASEIFRAGFSESLSRMPPREAPNNNPALTFKLCLREGDVPLRIAPLEELGLSRRIPLDGTSPAIFEMAKGWLSQCVEKHARCRERAKTSNDDKDSPRAETPPLPTRVLDVDPGLGDTVQLYVSQGERKPYAALSHCWGGDIPNKTVKGNLDELRHGIPISHLPQNFQDAITITRKLNIGYLWIDALCIVQDDAADWAHEADLMDEIYTWSTVTITGLDSSASTAGILRTQRLASVDIPHQPYAIQACTDNIRVALGKCILSKRAWCLQERLLAPRLLHFGANQLFWECRETLASEDDRCCEWRGSELAAIHLIALHRQLGNSPPALLDISRYWCQLVEEYSLRSLTFGMDKLPALLGTSQMFLSRYPVLEEYVAGLWRGDMVRGLCWGASLCTGPSRAQYKEERKVPCYYGSDICALFSRPEQKRAPSWSWASVDGSLWFPCSKTYVYPWGSEIEVLDISLANEGCTGILTLRGKVVTCKYVEPQPLPSNMPLSDVGTLGLCAQGHESETFAFCVLDFDRHAPRTCHALLIASINNEKKGKLASYLVLDQVAGSTFRRIGVATSNMMGANWEERVSIFDNFETRELSIE